ncbi:hypothetical protein TgHK011_009359 [Trichoderma gracile]|nr:hypothetical protein TgHK011_009359 [Trichoderma gracile]
MALIFSQRVAFGIDVSMVTLIATGYEGHLRTTSCTGHSLLSSHSFALWVVNHVTRGLRLRYRPTNEKELLAVQDLPPVLSASFTSSSRLSKLRNLGLPSTLFQIPVLRLRKGDRLNGRICCSRSFDITRSDKVCRVVACREIVTYLDKTWMLQVHDSDQRQNRQILGLAPVEAISRLSIMAATSLLALPDELLIMICRNFCLHCTCPEGKFRARVYMREIVAALRCLSQTCQRLRKIAQPVLFHDARPPQLQLFLRTITARPDLAAQVRAFCDLSHHYSERFENGDLGVILPGHVTDEEERTWDNDVRRMQTLLVPTLMRLPAVEDLVLGVSFRRGYMWETLFEMRCVKRLLLYPYNCRLGFGRLEDFLSLTPNVETLEIHDWAGSVVFPVSLPRLASLKINGFDLTAASLEALVESCPILEYFEFQQWGIDDEDQPLWMMEEEKEPLTWRQMQDILRPRRETLRHITFAFYPHSNEVQGQSYNPADDVGSFRDFEKLETLHVTSLSFRGIRSTEQGLEFYGYPETVSELVGMLPESLALLNYETCHDKWDGMEMLAQAIRQGHLPRLKTVISGELGTTLVETRSILAAVGVTCRGF